jgi:fructan beta-fructosidase
MLSLQTASEKNGADTPQYRPAYHFTPARHWMNDPNGLVYDDGVYHLFFQYHPDSMVWGPMHWGHATSRDLVHWEEQPVALYPDALGMIFSGSIVIDAENRSQLGPEGSSPWVALFTHHDMDAEKAGAITYQTQSIAFSLDKGESWTKYAGNPVIPNPGIKHFRDPKVCWHEGTGHWIMVLAGGDRVYFYRSANLIDWELASQLSGFDLAEDNFVECPDLLSLDVDGETKWVLIISLFTDAPNGGSGTRYIVGGFDGRIFVPEHQDIRWLDYGPDNYAGVTFHNTGDQKLLIGWMSNWRYAQSVPTAPWRSAMTLPRELRLERVGERLLLAQTVAVDLGGNGQSLAWDQGSHEISFSDVSTLTLCAEDQPSFTVTLGNEAGDRLAIGYDATAKCYFIDRTAAGLSGFSDAFAIRATAPRLALDGGTDVALYFDRGSVELFADGGLTVLTSLVFPTLPYASWLLETEDPVEHGQISRVTISTSP